MCKMLKLTPRELHIGTHSMRCGLCGTKASFSMLPMDAEGDKGRSDFGGSDLRKKVSEWFSLFSSFPEARQISYDCHDCH